MRQKEGFVLREVCGERVIIGEGLGAVDFGKLLVLNETAAWLWRKTGEMGEFTVDELADCLCEEYDVEREVALADVAATVAQWKEIGILE